MIEHWDVTLTVRVHATQRLGEHAPLSPREVRRAADELAGRVRDALYDADVVDQADVVVLVDEERLSAASMERLRG